MVEEVNKVIVGLYLFQSKKGTCFSQRSIASTLIDKQLNQIKQVATVVITELKQYKKMNISPNEIISVGFGQSNSTKSQSTPRSSYIVALLQS